SGFFAPPLELEFKLYPDLFFQKKAKGKIFVNYIFPTAVQKESIANILINDKFVSQVSMLEERDTQNLKEYLFLDTRTPSEYPASLLRGGKNSLKIDMKMIPLSWNPKTLQATIMDDSYFEIPEARHWIGMADLQDFTLSAFPFSIYPDLQDTHILLTDKRVSTLEALMQIMRFLGENLKYPPYYLTIGDNLDEVAKNKNLIVLGEYNEKWGEIYQNAPLVLTKHGYIRDIDLSNKFAETVEELEEKNIDESEEDRKQFIRLFETTEKSEYLITQFFQSPFNSDKTILMFNGQDIDIKAEIKQVLDAKFRGKIKGDLVITKLTGKGSREIYNFDVQPPYYVGDFDTISRVYFLIGSNPLLFVGLSVFLIILIVYFLRKTLLLYRMRHHESDASAND
ncbi:MAG TPA: hypothetical protein EYO61_04605, partial [Campylobacterales bacterium]|nr:hypothetical protein [Campylobacterales bacterium]